MNRPAETRRKVLRAGYRELRRYGYQGASLNRIVDACDVTKGALFHHFGSKAEIGYEVLGELERARIKREWLVGRELGADIVKWLRDLLESKLAQLEKRRGDMVYGSLVWNLATEMSALDEGFREMTAGLYNEWVDNWAGNLQRAQAEGQLSQQVDCLAYAKYLVYAIEGTIAAARIDGDLDAMRFGFYQLVDALAVQCVQHQPPKQQKTAVVQPVAESESITDEADKELESLLEPVAEEAVVAKDAAVAKSTKDGDQMDLF